LRDIYQRTGILWQPRDVAISKSEFCKTLNSLNWYQKNFGRRYTVLDDVKIGDAFIESMVEKLEF